MTNDIAKTFSEVDAFLDVLGEAYKFKIPSKLLNLIKEKKDNDYVPYYSASVPINEQGFSKQSLSMIALLDLNYWANEEEKQEIRSKLNKNEIEYQKILEEKYSIDNLFKKKDKVDKQEETTDIAKVEYKETLISWIINKIKELLKLKK